MHNTERDDVAKEQIVSDETSARALLKKVDSLNLHLEQRHPGKPLVCEVVGSEPLELVVVVPGESGAYTLQALRPLAEGEDVVLKIRGGSSGVHANLFNCRKARREGDHPQLHLATLHITQGSF